jgi:ketosteroid isomerase-like protein
MSQENIELAKKGYAAIARRDFDAVLDFLDPDIESHNPPEVPEAGVHRGREAVLRDWSQMDELFEDFSMEVDEFIEAGDELVVFLRYRARARGSAAIVEAQMAHVLTIRDGKAVCVRQFLNREAALEAAGLSEQDAHAGS